MAPDLTDYLGRRKVPRCSLRYFRSSPSITQIPTISLMETLILTITHTQSTTVVMEHTISTLMESTPILELPMMFMPQFTPLTPQFMMFMLPHMLLDNPALKAAPAAHV